MKHNEPFEDDGRTVADMSGIEHDSIWLPRRRKQGHTPLCAGNAVAVIADDTPCAGLVCVILAKVYGGGVCAVYTFI